MVTGNPIENEQPHWINEGNMDDPTGYWRQFRRTSDGRYVIGNGITQQQAIDDAERAYQLREAYLAKADPERLTILLAKPVLLMNDLCDIVQILGTFALVQMQEKSHGDRPS